MPIPRASALYRIEQLCQESVVTVPRRLIAEAIDLVVFIRGRGTARRIETIAEVTRPRRATAITPSTTCPQTSRHLKGEHYATRVHTARSPSGSLATAASIAARCRRRPMPPAPNMPWEQPLQQILDSVQGPVAKIIAVIIIIIDRSDAGLRRDRRRFRRLIQIVFGLSIAFAASSFFLSFFSFGGGALVSMTAMIEGFEVAAAPVR